MLLLPLGYLLLPSSCCVTAQAIATLSHIGGLRMWLHRFSARYREYKYFVLEQPGGDRQQQQPLDVAAMREAAAHFVGEHDFRHFCKASQHHTQLVQALVLVGGHPQA